jgi:sugar phosphate permease
MSLAYDVGQAVCGVLAFDTCDRQEMMLLGLFVLALTSALLGMATLSRI